MGHRQSLVLFVGAALLLGAGCQGATPGEPDPQPLPVKGAVLLSDTEDGLRAGLMAREFNLVKMRDLWVRVTTPEIRKLTVIELRFINPRGESFYEITSFYEVDPPSGTIDTPEFVHPVPVRKVKQIPGGYALDRAIAIGGSLFQRYPMPGSWVVEARIRGVDGLLTSPMEIIARR